MSEQFCLTSEVVVTLVSEKCFSVIPLELKYAFKFEERK